MAIATYKYTSNFTIIGNDCFDDERLSFEALAIFTYLRSKPADWTVVQTQLAKRFKAGRDRVRNAINELIAAGYIRKVQERIAGRWSDADYHVLALPDAPSPEAPLPETPSPENRSLLSTDLLPTTDSTKRKKEPSLSLASEFGSIDADIDQLFEQRFWPAYPKRDGDRGKPEAKIKFRKLVKSGEDVEKIIGAAIQHGAIWKPKVERKPTEAKFIRKAVNWLQARGWQDEQAAPSETAFDTIFDIATHLEQRVRAHHERGVAA
jgi:hypothetical protein